MGERTSHPPGTISWADLATSDQDAAKAFYGGLLGWEYDDQPVGDGVTYSMAQLGGRSAAAINPQREEEAQQGVPPHWNLYITVDDVDAAAGQAGEHGGQVYAEPFDVSGGGRMPLIAIRRARSSRCGRRARASAPRWSTSRARSPGPTSRRPTP